jgi:hypothetical protein
MAWLGGLAGRSAKKNGVFRKNVGIPHIYRWVWYILTLKLRLAFEMAFGR